MAFMRWLKGKNKARDVPDGEHCGLCAHFTESEYTDFLGVCWEGLCQANSPPTAVSENFVCICSPSAFKRAVDAENCEDCTHFKDEPGYTSNNVVLWDGFCSADQSDTPGVDKDTTICRPGATFERKK